MNHWNTRAFTLFFVGLMLLWTPSAFAADALSTGAINSDLLLPFFVTALLMLLLLGFSLLAFSRCDGSMGNAVLFKVSLGSAWVVLFFVMVGYGLVFGENPTGFWGASLFFFAGDIADSLIFYAVLAAVFMFIVGDSIFTYLPSRIHLMVSILLLLLFSVVASWIWGEQGWLHSRGFIDITGSTVIHSVAGWMALAAFMGLGKQNDVLAVDKASSTSTVFSGMAIVFIWLGWLGLALGTTLYGQYLLPESASKYALLNTILAGCAGMVAASVASYMVNQKLHITTVALGCIAGLVSVSAGAAMMLPLFAILTGFVGGAVAIFSVLVLRDMHIYDRTAVISAHALPGAWGTLAVGVFYSGDFFNPDRILVQMMGVALVFLVVFGLTWLLFRLLRNILPTQYETKEH